MLIRHIEKFDNFLELSKEVEKIISTIGFRDNQISCQNLNENQNDWYISNGSLKLLEEQDETKYSFINKDLSGSILEKTILKYNAFRTRIMCMPPRRCYSVHSDLTKRIHIPVITNDQCWMVWPLEGFCFQLLQGRVYMTDTTKQHSFFNGHETLNRIHIVMSVKD